MVTCEQIDAPYLLIKKNSITFCDKTTLTPPQIFIDNSIQAHHIELVPLNHRQIFLLNLRLVKQAMIIIARSNLSMVLSSLL